MVWQRLGRLLSGSAEKIGVETGQSLSDEGDNSRNYVINQAHYIVDTINKNMRGAHEAKVIRHRRYLSDVAKQRLSDLKGLVSANSFLSIENLAEIEGQLAIIDANTDKMEAGPEGLELASFLKSALHVQCAQLGIPLEVIELKRLEGKWVVAGEMFKRPEDAALAHFELMGSRGLACEGKALLLLMKASCLDTLAKVNQFGMRADASISSFEGQAFVHRDHAPKILGDIETASEELIRRNLSEIFAQPNYLQLYPAMDTEALLAIWQSLTPGLLKTFAEHIFVEHGYRAGWPDLTIVDKQRVRFVEVKTSDKMHASQRQVILDILKPNDVEVSVLQLKDKGRPKVLLVNNS